MKQVPWSAYDGKVCVGVGTVTAEGEREALEQVLQGKVKGFAPRPDRWYTVRAGGVTASSLGSEMGAVAAQTGKDSQGDAHTNSANRAAERRQLDEAARKVMADALKRTTAGVDRLKVAMDELTESGATVGQVLTDAVKSQLLDVDGTYEFHGLPLDQVEPCPCGKMTGAFDNNDGDLACNHCGRGVMLRAPSPTPVLNYVDCTRSANGKHHWARDLGASMVGQLGIQEECRNCRQRRIIVPPPSISQLDPGRAPYDVSVLGLVAQQRCRDLAIDVARSNGIPSHVVPNIPTRGEIDIVNGTVLLDYYLLTAGADQQYIRVAISHKELLSFLP